MSARTAKRRSAGADFDEKEFYLDEFRGHTLCVAVQWAECERGDSVAVLRDVARDLIGVDARLIVLVGVAGRDDGAVVLRRVRRRLAPAVDRGRASFLDLRRSPRRPGGAEEVAGAVWPALRAQPLLVALVSNRRWRDVAQSLAVRLRLRKLVLAEPAGGVGTRHGGPLSFMDAGVLEAVLRTGEAEWAGLARRRGTLSAVLAALRGGVAAVNLCSLAQLDRELFTYEGSGTLFTRDVYCHVERLGIDQFEAVERLLARGVREGYLKARTPEEVAALLLEGYGATIGDGHLAGVCGLLRRPYRAERAAEIAGLYTMTRFKGEGVAVRLVERALRDARAGRMAYVFACTTDPRAQEFFLRQGFRRVGMEDVPLRKWCTYDGARRQRLAVFRIDLPDDPATGEDLT